MSSTYVTHIIFQKPCTFSTCIIKEQRTYSIKYKNRTGAQGAGGHSSEKETRVSQGALPATCRATLDGVFSWERQAAFYPYVNSVAHNSPVWPFLGCIKSATFIFTIDKMGEIIPAIGFMREDWVSNNTYQNADPVFGASWALVRCCFAIFILGKNSLDNSP